MAQLNGEDFPLIGTDLAILAERIFLWLKEQEIVLEFTVAEAKTLRADRESFEPRLSGAIWTAAENHRATSVLSGKQLVYDPTLRVLLTRPKQG